MSIKDQLIGAKGGGSKFRNTPDNLRSTDTFEALIGLTAGRIRGLAPGGLQNLFIDDVPVEDGQGNTNLTDFRAVLFDGDPAVLQPIQLALGGSSGANNVNLSVNNPYGNGTPGEWRNGFVSQTGVDFIDLRFVVNQLFRQDKKGIYTTTARLEVQLQPSGSSQWINPFTNVTAPAYNVDGFSVEGTMFQMFASRDYWTPNGTQWADSNPGYLTIDGKTTSAFVKELRVAVPNTGAYANKTWGVRVRLLDRDTYTQDENEERRSIVWESVAGVSSAPIGDKEEWRGLAYLHLNGKASDQLTGVPSVGSILDLSLCRVPPASVWDAETQQYTGATWDGATEEIKWTRCPAFQLKDLIEDGVSGISALVPGSTLNKWDALEASKWFSQLVPDGKGGTHPRYTMNYLLDQAQSVNDLMQYIAGAVGAFCYDQGDGTWRLIADKPTNPAAIFTKENIVGEFGYSHTDIDTRYNDITGVFRDESRRYEETRVRVFDQPHIDMYGRNHQSLALVGCTNRQEALRRVKIRQLVSLNETRMVNFTTNRQGKLLSPFSVILVADQDLGLREARTTGRLIARDGDTLTLRDTVRLEVGVGYKLHVTVPNPDYNPNATAQPGSPDWRKPTITITRNIENSAAQRGDVTQLYIDEALPENTPENANIAFEAVGLPTMPKQYRVLSVEPDQNGELVTVSAVEIYTNKWNESDNVNEDDILAQQPNKVTLPPETPEGGMFTVNVFEGEFGNTRRVLNVSWLRPASMWVDGFKVEMQLNGGAWQTLSEKSLDSYVELTEPTNGSYTFRIHTLDRRGGISTPLIGSYELTDLAGNYAPVVAQGPLADRPVEGGRQGDRYTTTDQNPNLTYVWTGSQWVEESNYVVTADQIKYFPPEGGPATVTLQDLMPAAPGATPGAPVGTPVGGMEAGALVQKVVQVDTDLEEAKADITNLFTTYGSTESAAVSATAAALAAQNSQAARLASEGARDASQSAQQVAETARNNAQSAQAQAETARNQAQAANTAAGLAVIRADEEAANALTQAQASAGSAATSAGHATTATNKANEAAGSASAASGSAIIANSKAGDAADSASAAATSASSASTSATNAGQSASAANTSSLSATTARDAARAASAASYPDNFFDPSNWYDTKRWGGSVTFEGGVAKTFNGGSVESTFSMPVSAGETYRLTARCRVINQGGGNLYLGVVLKPSGNISWIGIKPHVALNQWETVTVEVNGSDVVSVAGTTAMSVLMLIGYDKISDGEISMLRMENITSEKASSNSAASSLSYRNEAVGAASTAAGHASTASTQAGLATQAQDNAAGSASAANTSRNEASSFAGAASTSASSAASSLLSATVAAATVVPSTFVQEGTYFSYLDGDEYTALRPEQAYTNIYYPVTSDFGKTLRATDILTGYQHVTLRKRFRKSEAGKRYRLVVRGRQLTDPALGQTLLATALYGTQASNGALVYGGFATVTGGNQGATLTVAGGVQSVSLDFIVNENWTPDVNGNLANHFTAGLYVINVTAPGVYSAGSWEIISMELTDITALYGAEQAANAALSNASSASASQTAAGQSASAASDAASVATTKAGEASTSAGSAATSASNAAGSASTASTQASLAASARDAARAASLATIPDNFLDPNNWENSGDWGGSISIVDGVLKTFNGGSAHGKFHIPLVASDRYRITVRHRVVNQGGGSFYIGVRMFPTPWVQWVHSAAEGVVNQWYTDTFEFTGSDIGYSDQLGMRPQILKGYNGISDAEVSLLRLENITPTYQSAQNAAASLTNSQTAQAHRDAAGASANAAQASRLASEAANGTAQTAATNASASATSADASRSAASSSASLSAAFSNTRGITPNGNFGAGIEGWAGANLEAVASYDGRSGLLRNLNGGGVDGMIATLVNIDTSRKYRVRCRMRVATGGTTPVYFFIGFGGFDANKGALLHTDGTYNYPAAANAPITESEGWREFVSPVITGEGAASLKFPVGTRYATPVFYGDYTRTGHTFYVDELYLEDVTESVEAATSASVANSSAATATGAASTAQSNANLAANYRDDANTYMVNAQQNATAAGGHRVAAESAASAASGSAVVADGHRSSAASSASLAATYQSQASGSAGAASNSANAASGSAAAADGHRASAASQASLSATYRDQSQSAYTSTVLFDGNLGFEQGLDGWTQAVSGVVADNVTPAGHVGAAWGTGKKYWIMPSGQEAFIYSRKSFPVDTNRIYEFAVEAGAYVNGSSGAKSLIYIGFVGLDASGNPVDHGAYGSWRYAMVTGEDVVDGTLLRKRVLVTGEGNDGWLKFPTGTRRIRMQALVNHQPGVRTLGNPTAYVGGYEITDVTDRETAKSSATAASTSASSADAFRATAASEANLAASYRDQANSARDQSSSSANASSASAATAAGHASSASTSASLSATFRQGAVIAASETFPSTFEAEGEYFAGLGGSESNSQRPEVVYGSSVYYPVRGDFGKVLRVAPVASWTYMHFAVRKRIPRSSTRKYRITAKLQVLTNSPLGQTYCVATTYGLSQDYNDVKYDGVTFAASPGGVPQAVLATTSNGVFEIGIDFWSGPTSTGAAWMTPGIYVVGFDGTNYGNVGMVDIISLKVEDVTDSLRASTQADIATSQATSANSQRSLAETAAGLSATYRDQAFDHAGTASAQAGIATTQAGIATAQAAAATSTATLVARLNAATINPNSGLLAWPTGANLPDYWSLWAGPFPSRVQASDGEMVARFTVAENQEGGIAQYSTGELAQVGPGKYVIEVATSIVSGPVSGAGVLVYWFDAGNSLIGSGAISFPNDLSTWGVAPGWWWNVGQINRFSKTITAPAGTRSATVYAMANWSGFGQSMQPKTIDFHYVGLKPAGAADAGFGELQASVSVAQGAIAALEGAAAYYEIVTAASGSTPATVQLKAGKNGSAVNLIGDKVSIKNPVNGQIVDVATFENGVARISSALIRRLRVAPRTNSQIFLPVMLRPLIRIGSDGQTINYQNGETFGAVPERIVPDLNGLPALAAGETYDVRAVNITATNFGVYAKKITAADPVAQTTGAGTNVGGTPQWQVHKPTALDAYNGNYQFTFTIIGTLIGSEPAPGGGGYYDYRAMGNLYMADTAGNMQLIGTYNEGWGGFNASGTRTITVTVTSSMPCGQTGNYEFGVHPTDGAISSFDGVLYATQVQSNVTSLTSPISWVISPPLPDE